MSIYTKQKVFCQTCGKQFETTFQSFGGEVCGRNCFEELQWRKILSNLGKEYYPDPKAGTYESEWRKSRIRND